jgi:hypothetical protein
MRTQDGVERLAHLSGIDVRDPIYYSLEGELLIHVFFSDVFYDYVVPAIDANDLTTLHAISDLCEEMLASDDDDLLDAVGVSMLEPADIHRPRTDPLVRILGPRSWAVLVDAHRTLEGMGSTVRPLPDRDRPER